MAKYVAFLRAINVGKHQVKMTELRAHFEALGFDDVETFIASGNVIFESPTEDSGRIESEIEAHLLSLLGYEVATFVRTKTEVARIAAHTPFPDVTLGDADRIYVNFLRRALGTKVRRQVEALGNDEDRLALVGRDLFWLRSGPLMEATIDGKALDKLLGVYTNRNMNTVRKLAARI